MEALRTMVFPGQSKKKGQAGATPAAAGGGLATLGRPCITAAVSAVCVFAVFGAMNVSAAPARATTTSVHATALADVHAVASRNRSGLSWASGAYLPDATPATASAFGVWRGHPLDVVVAWLNQSTWADITDPDWLYKRWRGSPYTMAFSVAMLPTDVPRVSISSCANGAYNSYWKRFGRVIRSYGLGHSIIRLGWEFNGTWYRWKATDPSAWAECWRRIVTSAWSTAPGLRWDWNVNRGVSPGLLDPARAYPGNAYVSMVGIDSYDWWLPATTAAGWHDQLDGKQGLNYWLGFAEAHGKRLSVPEWGNIRYGKSAGGDDPQYVRDMRAFFRANAHHIAFEANFQGYIGSYAIGDAMAEAAAAYKADF